MRKLSLLIVTALLLFSLPALAVDDFYGPSKDQAQDSRRPKLNIGGREQASTPEQAAPGLTPGTSTWEEFYSQTIDWNMFLDRLYEVLTSDKMQQAHPEVSAIAQIYEDMGVFGIGTTDVKYAITGDSIYLMSRTSYDAAPDTIMGKALAFENQPLASAEFIEPGDYMLYIGITGLVDRLALELEAISQASTAIDEMGMEDNPFNGIAEEMGMEDFSQVMAMLDAMRVQDMASSVLTGEMGLVLYNLPPLEQLMNGDIMPSDLDMALFIGLKDVDYARNLVASFGGEMGIQQIEQPHDDFTYYLMDGEETVGLLLGQGMGIITPNMPALLEHMHRDNVGLGLEPVQLYCDLNMAKLHEYALPIIEMGREEIGDVYLPDQEAAYLFNLPEPEAIGHISMMCKIEDNASFTGIEMKKALVQYLAYYASVFACGALQSDLVDELEDQLEGFELELNSECSGDCADCPAQSECSGNCGDCAKGEGQGCEGCPK